MRIYLFEEEKEEICFILSFNRNEKIIYVLCLSSCRFTLTEGTAFILNLLRGIHLFLHFNVTYMFTVPNILLCFLPRHFKKHIFDL